MSLSIPARPTTYRGIRMRSRLEARVAASLDSVMPGAWEYEPQAFANERGQYLPDFRVTVPSGHYYLEVKPTLERALLAMERMQIIWDSEPGATLLVLMTPDGVEGMSLRADGNDRTWRRSYG